MSEHVQLGERISISMFYDENLIPPEPLVILLLRVPD